ncbi:DUF4166 domain-containing protein, partial [Aquabacterium sp.]|uniref:DUF4166 domain-containing protein n=1 Tax=Aquabacterium sp. TaxID=1872578 RepID=UPI002C0A4BC2
IRFELEARANDETWTRHFPSRTMRSRLQLQASQVLESFGPVRLAFEVHEVQGRFEMRLRRLQLLGIPCPRWLMPQIVAHETGQGDQLHFHVEAALPGLGRVAGYRGHLVIPP